MQKVLSGRYVMICREIPVIPSGVKTKGKTTMNIGKLMTATGQLVDDLENLLVDLQCDNVDRPSNDSDAEMDTRDAVTRELRTIYNRFEAKVRQAIGEINATDSRIDALVDCLIDGIEMNYSTHEAWRKVATEILALNGNDRVPDESKGLPEEDWRPE